MNSLIDVNVSYTNTVKPVYFDYLEVRKMNGWVTVGESSLILMVV